MTRLHSIKENKNCRSTFRLLEHKQTSRAACKTRYAGISQMYSQSEAIAGCVRLHGKILIWNVWITSSSDFSSFVSLCGKLLIFPKTGQNHLLSSVGVKPTSHCPGNPVSGCKPRTTAPGRRKLGMSLRCQPFSQGWGVYLHHSWQLSWTAVRSAWQWASHLEMIPWKGSREKLGTKVENTTIKP